MWGPNSKGATASSKPETFRSLIPTSLLSDSELKKLLELSQSNENKDRIKGEAAKLVEEGAFGFVSQSRPRQQLCRAFVSWRVISGIS